METRKLQLSGTQTQDSIRADITFHLILLGSSVCSVGSFLDKGEQLGQIDRLQHHIFTIVHLIENELFLTCEALADIFMCHIC